jgi:apolipoprotein D and lipocalin family protein
MHLRIPLVITLGMLTMLVGCKSSRPPITTAPKVELARFMGPWYVIGNIPTSIEREAFNPSSHTSSTPTAPSRPRFPSARAASTAR